MANPSFFTSQKHDFSQGTNWSSSKYLKGDGTWDVGGTCLVANTVFVSKGGNDSTGVVERLDKPFLTIAAARTALLAYYTGGTAPSATNRILVVVFPGTYTEKIVLANYVDWDLTNSVIDLQAGAFYTIDDGSVQCDSIIYGNATIKRTTAGTLGCINISNASTNLTLECDTITCTRGVTIVIDNGIALISTKRGISCSFGAIIQQSLGTLTIKSDITCSGTGSGATAIIECLGGTQVIHGDMVYTGNDTLAFVYCDTGTQTTYGNIISNAQSEALFVGSGTQVHYGNISSSVSAVIPATCSGGTQRIVKGRIVTTGTDTDAYRQTGGTVILDGCTLIATGTGNSIADGSTVLIYGDCVGNKSLGTAVVSVGTLTINSSVI